MGRVGPTPVVSQNAEQVSVAVDCATSEDDVVILRSIGKSFGETIAVREATLSARAGEIHAIVGENGSGKSTLAKIVAGVLPPDSGDLAIFGKAPRSPRDARQLGLAMVFQEVLVAEGASVLENLFVGHDGFAWSKLSKREKISRANALLPRLLGSEIDLKEDIAAFPLSVRQWVVIARALLSNPRVLILDEATAALDQASVERFHAELLRLREEGVCVIVVTHRIAELTAFADRATVLRDGFNVGTLNRGDLSEDNLLRLMTGETATRVHQRTESLEAASDLAASHPESALLRARGMKLSAIAAPIDLDLRAGEVVGLIGLEGQGQVDFVRVLAGIQPPIAGEVLVRREEDLYVPVRGAKSAQEAGIAYIPGDRKLEGLFPNLSVFENFGLPLYRREKRLGFILRRRVHEMFTEQEKQLSVVHGGLSAPIGSLSGGNQQKIVIGRSLATSPSVVVLNDPTRGVDVSTKREFYDLLERLSSSGKGVLFLSNEIEEFIGLCHRVAVFRDDSVLTILEGHDIRIDAILSAMFGYLDNGRQDTAGMKP